MTSIRSSHWWENSFGFGFASPKHEGMKLSPDDYLLFNGEYPAKSFYTEEEYTALKEQGWEYVE